MLYLPVSHMYKSRLSVPHGANLLLLLLSLLKYAQFIIFKHKTCSTVQNYYNLTTLMKYCAEINTYATACKKKVTAFHTRY